MKKDNTFLVTGSAGFIPSHLIDKLLSLGYQVIGLDDLSIGSKEAMRSFIDNRNFQFIKGDVCDYKLLKRLIPQVKYLYHGAVRGVSLSTDEPIKDLTVNTESTLMLLDLAHKNKISFFIYPSSASVYGDPKHLPENEEDNPVPLSPYGVSKLASERYCLVYHKIYNLPVVCLRYFNNYGPRQRKDSLYGGVISIFFEQALNGQDLTVYTDGKQTRDFIFVEDTITATVACIDNEKVIGEVINIATGKETSINSLVKKVIEISGKKVGITYVDKRLIDNIQRRVADIKKARRLLSFSAKTELEEGLKKTFLWFQKSR